MKLNLYNFASMLSTNNAETSMFAMIVATKLTKSYPLIEKSVEKKNPKTESALLGFAMNCYDEFMANIHPDIDSTDSKYWAIFAEFSGKVHSLCNWENGKNPKTVMNSILTVREKKETNNTETETLS